MATDYTRTYAGWAEAFTIFHKYKANRADVAAEHDTIYAGPDPATVEQADLVRLKELGWHIQDQYDCFYHFV
jgi:hypothetical protein